MKNLSIDIETRSSEDLTRCGVYRYAESPDFTVLLFGYSCDGGPVRVADLASGESLPEEVFRSLRDDAVEKWAFNAAFERVCLSRFLRDRGQLGDGAFLSPVSWRCSMVWCAYLGFPHSLEAAGAALGLERKKLSEGKELISRFCVPDRASGGGPRCFPEDDPEAWERFVAYNRRDVEAENEIRLRLAGYPVPESVWREYALDQEINDRGIRTDPAFVCGALALDASVNSRLTARMKELTGIDNPNSLLQIRSWLSARGFETESLNSEQVGRLIETVPPEIRQVLELRQQLAKNSVKKYQAIADSVCADGRIRGMFRFYGASRSGRWAGRGVQLQNLPRNRDQLPEEARAMILRGDSEGLVRLFGSVPDALSELTRTAFVPVEGKKFIVADFNAIEARVLAWLAGEAWRTEVFRTGGDIYCASASRMFGVPVEKHGANADLRQKGKVAELALGYGGGAGALEAMGAVKAGVKKDELQGLVNTWRAANPRIVRLWRAVESAVKLSVRNRIAVTLPVGIHSCLAFSCTGGLLAVRLPSGRSLNYVQPLLSPEGPYPDQISYMGINASKQWARTKSYGAKFVENIVQGISRDLLCCAMENLRDCRIVAHVHDEVIIEAEPDADPEEICRRMAAVPVWAEGLELKAEGYGCAYYCKR